ncbi:hypothetical protein HanHA300_Chr06g0207261 [Helianthus annuus]|nr:hypothetical protein HanHA300_Chr06g0207261 [Helianthus annuus]KAJ0573053.1 hypothetical protein HanHA89_Chr06g0222541 [Helianthus annuus]KAJ0740355.1 hypothetical protein HanOQP8_Chr06g0215901 [Helianthus annuus]
MGVISPSFLNFVHLMQQNLTPLPNKSFSKTSCRTLLSIKENMFTIVVFFSVLH